MMRIDAHHHFWRLERRDHEFWVTPDVPALYRDVMPEQLAPLLAEAGIARTIAVQAAETVRETEFLLETAERSELVAGVVGWADFELASGLDDARRLAAHPKLVGLRPMLQDIEDRRWLFRPVVQPMIALMKELELRFDALVRPQHLHGLAEFVAAHPDLPVVIDHAAKPLIAWRQIDEWEEGIRAVAASGPVCCKISGITNNAGDAWDVDKLRPYVDVLIDAFGADRLMFGSDWPMIDLAGDYVRWVRAVEALVAHLPADEQAMIFGGTAARFYGVGDD